MSTLRIAAEKARFTPPRQVTDDTSVLTLKNLALEPLLRWEDARILPGLFATWRHEQGGRRWIFRVRDGATWQDGVAFVAQDVLDFVEGVLGSLDMFGMKWSYSRYLAEARITAPDARTVVVENPTPFADILDIFSEFYPCRLTPEGLPLLGTGPWRVVDYAAEQRVVLQRIVPGEGPSRIDFRAMPHAEDRLAALRAGEVDVAMNLERVEARLPFEAPFTWGRAVNTLSVMYYLNCFRGIFTSPAARLAANLAVDRRAMVEEVFHGLGQLSASIVSPMHLGGRSAGLAPHPHDPERAKRLLDGLHADGPLLLRTPETLPEKALEISARVAAALESIGLPCRIEVQKDRPEYAREIGRKNIGDLAVFDSSPHSSYRVLNDKISSAVQGVWWQGHDDSALEPMILAANHAVEDAAREEAYARCLRQLHANPPWVYLFHPIDVYGAAPSAPPISLDSKGMLALRP
jgi:peptide/nickel transport system substrate-binding protein